jgi:hypothetical protein
LEISVWKRQWTCRETDKYSNSLKIEYSKLLKMTLHSTPLRDDDATSNMFLTQNKLRFLNQWCRNVDDTVLTATMSSCVVWENE